MIREGRITVNGRVVTGMGSRVDPEKDEVRVDGRPVRAERFRYLLLHKPRGYVSTVRDPAGRRTVMDLLPNELDVRLYPVGRLDYDSSGLLLLTNDGELSHRLTHPSYQVEKVYRVRVKGKPSPDDLERLRRGVRLSDGPTAPARVRLLDGSLGDTVLQIGIREGRNRQVRRMLAAVGHEVKELRRVGEGVLSLGNLHPGAHRFLAPDEAAGLRRSVGLGAPATTGNSLTNNDS